MDTSLEFSFDGWTLRRSTGELLKDDTRIRLPIQSASVLEELLSRPGELVTREALIAKLWPRGVVEYGTALNTIVHRLRVALGDHADEPRYIETVPRRGYRFIGRLQPPVVEPARTATPARRTFSLRRAAAAGAASLLVLAAAGAFAPRDGALESGAAIDASNDRQAVLEQQARARILLQRRRPGDVDRARRYFGAVLVTDPDDAHAWAGLASARWLDVAEGRTPERQGIPQVMEAARRALALDPGLAEAHMRLVGCYRRLGEPGAAERHLLLAQAHEPTHPLVLAAAVDAALKSGRLPQAIELQWRAVAAEPLALSSRQNLVALLLMAGRLAESALEIERMRELQPTGPSLDEKTVEVLILGGRFDEALVLAQRLADDSSRHFYSTIAYHGLGRREESDASLRALVGTAGESEQVRIVEAMAYVGDRDAALDRLVASPAASCARHWLRFSPYLRSLHRDPRWEEWVDAGGRRDHARPTLT